MGFLVESMVLLRNDDGRFNALMRYTGSVGRTPPHAQRFVAMYLADGKERVLQSQPHGDSGSIVHRKPVVQGTIDGVIAAVKKGAGE